MTFPEFHAFNKIPRLSRDIILTEKLDGTCSLVYIDENNLIYAGSKERWLWGEPQEEIHNDNHGFAHWVKENKDELKQLGRGYHYGEFLGQGIQRSYGLKEKRFYLFNVGRWVDYRNIPCGQFPREYEEFYLRELKEKKQNPKLEFCPECCYLVPILYEGSFDMERIILELNSLEEFGSKAIPGFKPAEGLIVFHTAGKYLFKKTIIDDDGKNIRERK
jgi:hypothetical protein